MSASRESKSTPLAIVGMACRFPKADDLRTYWSNIVRGEDCITDIPETHWRPEDYFDPDPKKADMTYAKRGGFISQAAFDPLEYGIPPTAIEATDTSQLLGMMVAKDALRQAGYGDNGREFNRARTSVILGVTGALEMVIPLGARLGWPRWRKALIESGMPEAEAEAVVQRIKDTYVPWQENSFPGLLGNVVAGRIANYLDLGGTNCVVDAACASALSAVHLAALELEAGRSDMVLAGGVDTFNDIFMYMCFSKTPALSKSGDVRPFDRDGDGTMLGEGLGVLVLKRLADAERDGDRIIAVLRGLGSGSDGKGNAIYAPSSKGQSLAMRNAYENAGVDPRSVELVEAHGTGTKVGDATEVQSLGQVFGTAEQPWCAVGSVKSQIGHTKAAAGIAGLIKAAMALESNVLPPTIKVRQPLDVFKAENTPFYINSEARPWIKKKGRPRRAAVSAFGFGGSNFHAVLEEYKAEKERVDWDGRVQILAFSAQDRTALAARLKAFNTELSGIELDVAAAETRAAFKADADARLLLVHEAERGDLGKLMTRALSMLTSYQNKAHWSSPEGIYFGSGEVQGRLGILFPGQGSQYVGMLRDLSCRFPEMQNALAEADEVLAEHEEDRREKPLTDFIYPRPSFEEAAAKGHDEALRATQVAQPAIGAVSIGGLKVLRRFGIKPSATAGHSYGEIPALCASERFDTKALYQLSRLRGLLMAEGSGDKGAMVAVRAGLDEVTKLVEEHSLDVVPANKNAPDQVVLSGATHEIERAIDILRERQVSCKRLPVAAAFHSALVAKAKEPFYSELSKVDFPIGEIPVYANTTAKPYPGDAEEARTLLATQLLKPVEFVDQIRNMYADGIRTFLEVGPGARLTGLVKAILKEESVEAAALDASSGKRSGMADLARILAWLAAVGHPVDLAGWEEGGPKLPAKRKKGMTVWLSGANVMSSQTAAKAAKELEPIVTKMVDKETQKYRQAAEHADRRAVAAEQAASSKVHASAPSQAASPASSAVPRAPISSVQQPAVQSALGMLQQNIALLQQMQAETARLHQTYLEHQDASMQRLEALTARQQQWLTTGISQGFTQTQAAIAPAPVAPVQASQPAPAPAVRPEPVVQPIAAQAPAAAVADTPKQSSQAATDAVLAVVSEKTGYPEEMLEMSMSLDADLGIDSIKRVEILSALQERLNLEGAVRPDEMGSLATLADVVNALSAGTQPAAPQSAASSTSAAAGAGSPAASLLMGIVAEKTGYPEDMLEPEMSLDADLGIDSIKRVEILSALKEALPQAADVKPDEMGSLQTLADVIAAFSSGATVSESSAAPVSLPAAVAGPADDQVASALVAIVAEKTGYPNDMLELSMSLDADLGIDSIKRVEILSALKEALPQAADVAPDAMGSLQTLADVVTAFAGAAAPVPAATQNSTNQDEIFAVLLGIIAEKTGYPEDMLEPAMSLDADLGIDSIKRVEILSALKEALPGSAELAPDAMGSLQTLTDVAQAFSGAVPTPASPRVNVATPNPAAAEPSAPLVDPLQDAESELALIDRSLLNLAALKPSEEALEYPKGSAVWLLDSRPSATPLISDRLLKAGFEVEILAVGQEPGSDENLRGLVIPAPEQVDAEFLKQALFLLQKARLGLERAGQSGDAFFAVTTHFGGRFGLNGLEGDPTAAALSGLCKTACREMGRMQCRVFDLPETLDREIAQRLVAYIRNRAPLEIGINSEGDVALETVSKPVPEEQAPSFEKNAVMVVTGGARGVTSAVSLALSRSLNPKLVLLGRSSQPEEIEPEWSRGLTDVAAIKRAVIERAGKKLSPKEVNREYERVLADREMRNNLALFRQACSEVHYYTVDVRNRDAVVETMARIRREVGPVTGLVHGAGVLADRFIKDKTAEQFDLVYGTKALGLQNILAGIDAEALQFMLLFGSSTGRYGRKGQVDYAMANEVLNKTAQQWRAQHPNCRALCVNWGPWDGGMVTPELRKLFLDEGVGLIPLAGGAAYVLRELAHPGPAEVVIIGKVGFQPEPPPNKGYTHEAFRLTVSAADIPVLRDHVINGKAVVPMALTSEWLIHGALHALPGMHLHGIRKLSIFKGLILEDDTLSLICFNGEVRKDRGLSIVPIQLRDAEGVPRAQAEILLGSRPPAGGKPVLSAPKQNYGHNMETAYSSLFHGEQLQGLKVVEGSDADGIQAVSGHAPLPKYWLKKPLRSSWLTDPLVIDCAYQLMILWCIDQKGKPSLPTGLGRLKVFGKFPKGDVRIVARIISAKAHEVVADIEFVDPENSRLIARIESYRCVLDDSLSDAFARKQLPAMAGRDR